MHSAQLFFHSNSHDSQEDAHMGIIVSLTDTINRLSVYIGALFIFLSTLLAAINAILRFTIGAGFPWSEELCSYFVVMLVFICIPYLEYSDKQLSIGVLNSILKNKTAKKVITIIRGLFTLGFLAVLVYLGVEVAQKAFDRETVTFVLQIPRFILYSIVTAFFALAIISWIIVICRKGEFRDVL